MASRILFLCARESSRSLLAASLLAAQAGNRWEVWSTPTQDAKGLQLAEQVLHEQGIALISSSFFIRPTFGLRWEEGIVLCSGATDMRPFIPGVGRHRLWSVEDPPSADLGEEDQLGATVVFVIPSLLSLHLNCASQRGS